MINLSECFDPVLKYFNIAHPSWIIWLLIKILVSVLPVYSCNMVSVEICLIYLQVAPPKMMLAFKI